jgi:predicted SnoaL-like aldol condensation-catalyzing enzyme
MSISTILPPLTVMAATEYGRRRTRRRYKQHNPQAGNDLQAVKEFVAPAGPVDVDVYRVVAEGDCVAVHSHYKTWNMAGFDIFRFNDEGKIIEHWDVLQQVPETTASGNDMFSQLT